MTEIEMIERLKRLPDDINALDNDLRKNVSDYLCASEEKDRLIKERYAGERAPAVTSRVNGFSRDAQDKLDFYDDFIDDYERYIDNVVDEYKLLTKRKEEARSLLTMVMTLPANLTRVIYLAYLKRLPVDQLCENLFMSRSTYYRYRHVAIKMLAESFDPEK
ncbi:MAG: DUF1492 domain-containing protein [Clostridiales bacterium]|nr:DUF1492 domain-containing protein [Clostridiales bacterium]